MIILIQTGMNGAQSDATSNSLSGGSASGAHTNMLHPMSMQSLLAMACMGQTTLPTASSQTIPTAQLGASAAATPLCKFNSKIETVFSLS